MLLVSLHVDGTEWSGRTQILARSTAYAPLCINDRNLQRCGVFVVGRHHQYGSRRTVAGAVAASHAVGNGYAVFLDPYGMAYAC